MVEKEDVTKEQMRVAERDMVESIWLSYQYHMRQQGIDILNLKDIKHSENVREAVQNVFNRYLSGSSIQMVLATGRTAAGESFVRYMQKFTLQLVFALWKDCNALEEEHLLYIDACRRSGSGLNYIRFSRITEDPSFLDGSEPADWSARRTFELFTKKKTN